MANGNGCCAKGAFEDLWIQPAAGDAGGALGVALAAWITDTMRRHAPPPGQRRRRRRCAAPTSGPTYDDGGHCEARPQAGLERRLTSDWTDEAS